ncbi:MAG: ABC transporter ATP-binding protein [Bacteroidota bacterium]
MEIIHTEHIEKIYDDDGVPVHALHDVTFSIQKGEFLAIAGPSGSGKTTLLNIIGALDKPTNGEVILDGDRLNDKQKGTLSTLRLNKIGFVFQAYNLIPVLSAMENIEFKMMLLNIPEQVRRKQSMKIMEELGIAELAHKRPNEMSGGQQQRVAVARAIVNNPPIVLADEPTANLDSVTAFSLIDIMRKMNEEKKITFVFSSHDHQVLQNARRVILLRDGRIEQDTTQ